MAVIIKRVKREPTPIEVLAHVGLSESRVDEHNVPIFLAKDRVCIVGNPPPGLVSWRTGDTGVVKRLCRGSGMHDRRPKDDLYFVYLDKPRQAGKELVCLYYNELQLM